MNIKLQAKANKIDSYQKAEAFAIAIDTKSKNLIIYFTP
jgi:hypothetical protein